MEFHASQSRTQAGVHTATKAHVLTSVSTGDVEDLGLFEDCGVAVGPAQEKKYRFAGLYWVSLDVNVLGGDPRRHLTGGVIPKDPLDRVGPSLRAPTQLGR